MEKNMSDSESKYDQLICTLVADFGLSRGMAEYEASRIKDMKDERDDDPDAVSVLGHCDDCGRLVIKLRGPVVDGFAYAHISYPNAAALAYAINDAIDARELLDAELLDAEPGGSA